MRTRRFTLVELMVAVAIVAVLAAIVIPIVHHMVSKAKHAEFYPLGEALLDAGLAYNAAGNVTMIALTVRPSDGIVKAASAPVGSAYFGAYVPFDPRDLDIRIEGAIRGAYLLNLAGEENTTDCAHPSPGHGWSSAVGEDYHILVAITADVDGNGAMADITGCEQGPGWAYTLDPVGRFARHNANAGVY